MTLIPGEPHTRKQSPTYRRKLLVFADGQSIRADPVFRWALNAYCGSTKRLAIPFPVLSNQNYNEVVP